MNRSAVDLTAPARTSPDLGGFAAVKEAFTKAASSRFGSGWAWLGVDAKGALVVENLWEHAYYLKYQNRRPEYIAAFYNVIHWAEVGRRYDEAREAIAR